MARLQILFQQYLDNRISADEITELWQLLKEGGQAGDLTPELQKLWEQQPEYTLPASHWNRQYGILKEAQQPVSVKRNYFLRYAAAAAIILFMLGGSYLLFNKKAVINQKAIVENTLLPHDVKAGRNGAILSFDNGKTIILDTAENGQLTADVHKTDRSITVQGTTAEYATLTTPRARQQQLVLADGTKVWLNAASSIHFPSAFLGKERVVEITGEAYFEVAKDATKPFIVKVNDATIEVLGTHFNVMAYTNEESVQTTLLEGSVKFRKGSGMLLLQPGQQSQLLHDGKIKLITHVDLDGVVAWKNGSQYFNNADIQTIMRQVERWYDVDVTYEGNIPKRSFSGDIPRDANLSVLLKLFEVNNIHFTIDGAKKKLIVMP